MNPEEQASPQQVPADNSATPFNPFNGDQPAPAAPPVAGTDTTFNTQTQGAPSLPQNNQSVKNSKKISKPIIISIIAAALIICGVAAFFLFKDKMPNIASTLSGVDVSKVKQGRIKNVSDLESVLTEITLEVRKDFEGKDIAKVKMLSPVGLEEESRSSFYMVAKSGEEEGAMVEFYPWPDYLDFGNSKPLWYASQAGFDGEYKGSFDSNKNEILNAVRNDEKSYTALSDLKNISLDKVKDNVYLLKADYKSEDSIERKYFIILTYTAQNSLGETFTYLYNMNARYLSMEESFENLSESEQNKNKEDFDKLMSKIANSITID